VLTTPLAPAVRGTAAALLVVVSAAACDVEPAAATVSADQVTGGWRSGGGATLALSTDRTFTAHGLDEGALAGAGCPGGHTEGGWAFFADRGDGGYRTSERAASGSEIGLSFARPAGEPCRMTLTVVDEGEALCATFDPDVPCDLDVRFARPVNRGAGPGS
jgi:hypothetical protein